MSQEFFFPAISLGSLDGDEVLLGLTPDLEVTFPKFWLALFGAKAVWTPAVPCLHDVYALQCSWNQIGELIETLTN